MSIKVGQKFDNFEVVATGKEARKAALRWFRYHTRCCRYEIEENNKRKEAIGRWLDKEYDFISHSQYMMGVGLVAYNDFLRRRAH